jgi:hypothetical protein
MKHKPTVNADGEPIVRGTAILFGHTVELPVKVPYYPPTRMRRTVEREDASPDVF